MIEIKNYSNPDIIDKIQVDFIEQLTRSIVDTTVSKVVFKAKEGAPKEWKKIVDIINKNDIERLLKSDVKQKSKYGKSYVGFDMFNNEPIIWVAPYNKRNQALRLNGMEQYVVRVVRDYSSVELNTPILKNEVTYTSNDKTYMFLGGFGVGTLTTPNKKEAKALYEKTKGGETFPYDYVRIKTPEYIKQQHKQGTFKHNLGIIPAMEMLNKDVNDYGKDMVLADWWPAREYIPIIDSYLKFICWEMELDHTRVVGMFSQQDLNAMKSSAKSVAGSSDMTKTLQEQIESYSLKQIQEASQTLSGESSAIKKKLIVRTLGSEGNNVSTMNSKFDGNKQFLGIQTLINLIYKICGYSWDNTGEGSATYENVSQTKSHQRGVYETTKEKIEFFNRQWKEFLSKIIYVLLNKQMELDEVKKNFDNFIDFEIISNILIQDTNDYRRIIELKQNDLLTTKRAIQLIWPDLSNEEIQEEINKIEQEELQRLEQENNAWNEFNVDEKNQKVDSKEFNNE